MLLLCWNNISIVVYLKWSINPRQTHKRGKDVGCPGRLIQLAQSQGYQGYHTVPLPSMAEEEECGRGTRRQRDNRGDRQQGKGNSWGKRRDKEGGGAEVLVPRRRSKRRRRWNRRSRRRKERRSSEVMEILYGGLVSWKMEPGHSPPPVILFWLRLLDWSLANSLIHTHTDTDTHTPNTCLQSPTHMLILLYYILVSVSYRNSSDITTVAL